MNYKQFFKLTWPVFILFLIFNLMGNAGFLSMPSIGGKHLNMGLFDPFSIVGELKCQSIDPNMICMYDPIINFIRDVLNIAWQYLLSCLVMLGYNKIKKK